MDLTISHKPLNREEIYAMFPPLKKMLVTLDYCLWFVVISCLAVVIADILYHRRGVPCFLIFWLLIFWLPFFLFAETSFQNAAVSGRTSDSFRRGGFFH